MAGKSSAAAALAVALLVGFASPAAAGPISVFTQITQTGGADGIHGSDEIPFGGLGSFGILTTGGGVNPLLTVPADQTTGHQLVVGYWPVLGFRDRAQYDAQRGTTVTIPETSVTLYAELWNGPVGQSSSEFRRLFIDTTITATVGVEPGQSAVDWRFTGTPGPVRFSDDTVVTLSYTPVRMPDGVPSIFFDDGSPGIGFPGSGATRYYPTLLEATLDVTRPPTDPGSGGPTGPPGGPAAAPEPAGAVLLAGFAAGGLIARRARRRFVGRG
jgi:hypothetical protein